MLKRKKKTHLNLVLTLYFQYNFSTKFWNYPKESWNVAENLQKYQNEYLKIGKGEGRANAKK